MLKSLDMGDDLGDQDQDTDPEENEDQVQAFLAAAPEFRLSPPDDFPAPLTDGFLKLTPARHGTDGFFAAWLRRS